MRLRNAALLAFVATLLVAAYLTFHFVMQTVSAARGLIAPANLFPDLLYAFAAISLAVFFFVFQRSR